MREEKAEGRVEREKGEVRVVIVKRGRTETRKG
jgi:hypothetical protein